MPARWKEIARLRFKGEPFDTEDDALHVAAAIKIAPVPRHEALGVDRGKPHLCLHELIPGTEVVSEQLQHPGPRVRAAGVPVHHRDTRELRRISYQLGFARYLDTQVGELSVQISVHSGAEVPVGFRNRRAEEDVIVRKDGPEFIRVGPGAWGKTLADGLNVADHV